MANFSFRDKRLLEELFGMSSGYVLDFTNQSFAEFFLDTAGLDIYDDFFNFRSGSKANRLRAFWSSQPDEVVGPVVAELIALAEEQGADPKQIETARAAVARLARPSTNSSRSVEPVHRLSEGPAIPRDRPVEIFFSYAHEDEGMMDEVRRQFIIFERAGHIIKWHDRVIMPGDEWAQEIDGRLRRAEIILLFVSPHFIESKYCYEREVEIALERHAAGEARVVPVILRPCAWEEAPFAKLQALPRDARPVSRWNDRDVAALEVARGVMKVVAELRAG